MDSCICNLQDEYYTKVSECAKECGAVYELKPNFLKSSACSKSLSIKPRFAAYVSSRDQAGTPAWSVTVATLALPSSEALSSEISEAAAAIKSLTGSSTEVASSTAEASSSVAATISQAGSASSSDTAAAATTEASSSSEAFSTTQAATIEAATTSTQSSSSNFAVNVGCGSLISLILLSLL